MGVLAPGSPISPPFFLRPCKNSIPYNTPFQGFEQRHQQEKREKKKEKPKIVVYLSSSAGRTHFAQTHNYFIQSKSNVVGNFALEIRVGKYFISES
jgi:hypothetical protein